MRIKKLTLRDLLSTQEVTNGFGLFNHEVRRAEFWRLKDDDPYSYPILIDTTVVDIANRLYYSLSDIQGFMDSKLGRWAGDEISSESNSLVIQKILLDYMTRYQNLTPAEKCE